MTSVSYAVSIIPSAHRQAINRLIAMIEGEDVLASENITRPANADGSYTDPEDVAPDATHWYGGRYVDAQWLMIYQNLGTLLPAPAGGWPLIAGGGAALTEVEAAEAAGALVIQVTTGPADPQMPQVTLGAVCAALGLVPIEPQ